MYELTNISCQKYLKERRHEIIDTLYIAACRMSNGPYIQDSFQTLTYMSLVELAKESNDPPSVCPSPSITARPVLFSVHQFRSGAISADRALQSHVQMLAEQGWHIPRVCVKARKSLWRPRGASSPAGNKGLMRHRTGVPFM